MEAPRSEVYDSPKIRGAAMMATYLGAAIGGALRSRMGAEGYRHVPKKHSEKSPRDPKVKAKTKAQKDARKKNRRK